MFKCQKDDFHPQTASDQRANHPFAGQNTQKYPPFSCTVLETGFNLSCVVYANFRAD